MPSLRTNPHLELILKNKTWIIMILVFCLFITQTLYAYPFALLALAGIVMLIAGMGRRLNQQQKVFLSLFLLIWAPMLFSLTDAIDLPHSSKKAFGYLMFLPAGLYVLHDIYQHNMRRLLAFIIFLIMLFWIVDGCFQFIYGKDLFGYPYTPPQLKGIFYPKVRMPYLLAVLAPLFLSQLLLHQKNKPWIWLLIIPFIVVLLLGGKRTAWMMLAFSCSAYLLYLFYASKTIPVKKLLLIVLLALSASAALITQHAPLKNRVLSTLPVFSSDQSAIEKATAMRLSLWDVALDIYKDNWINGIGPRGYRHVFSDYAGRDHFWLQAGREGTTHPHQSLLEIMCESGTLGLLGYILFYFYLIRLTFIHIKKRDHQLVPWYLGSLTAFLPLNAHLAFYGAYWSCFSWWMLITTLAITQTQNHAQDTHS